LSLALQALPVLHSGAAMAPNVMSGGEDKPKEPDTQEAIHSDLRRPVYCERNMTERVSSAVVPGARRAVAPQPTYALLKEFVSL
jgi:hypothetical protein